MIHQMKIRYEHCVYPHLIYNMAYRSLCLYYQHNMHTVQCVNKLILQWSDMHKITESRHHSFQYCRQILLLFCLRILLPNGSLMQVYCDIE